MRARVPNYPPGESGCAHYFAVEGRCPNGDCGRYGEPVEIRMYEELGGCFFEHDDQAYCPGCGTEMNLGD